MAIFGRSLWRKFHHLDDALAVVLSEVKGLAVGGGAEAGLQAGGLFIECENRRDLAGRKPVKLDGGAGIGIVIEEVKTSGRYRIVSPETQLGAAGNNDCLRAAARWQFPYPRFEESRVVDGPAVVRLKGVKPALLCHLHVATVIQVVLPNLPYAILISRKVDGLSILGPAGYYAVERSGDDRVQICPIGFDEVDFSVPVRFVAVEGDPFAVGGPSRCSNNDRDESIVADRVPQSH